MPKNVDGIKETIRTSVNPIEVQCFVNKLNWKNHPERQKSYIRNSIKKHGWIGSALKICANTERIIDGHGRLEIALKDQLTTMPVDVGFWTRLEGDELLATLDPTIYMASTDGNALKSLTEATLKHALSGKSKVSPTIGCMTDVHSFAQNIVKKNKERIVINRSKTSSRKIIGDTSKTKRDKRESHADNYPADVDEQREDVHYPSKFNVYGLPDLLKSKLHTNQRQIPRDTFDRTGRSLTDTCYYCDGTRPFDSRNHLKPIGGYLGFFTEDDVFEKYYRQPAKYLETLIDEKWFAVFEPDYSTYWTWPFAKRLYSVYKSRWCARYWQESGIRIIPLIRRTNDLERDKWLYTSLPEKCPIMGMQIRMGGGKNFNDPDYWNCVGASLHHCVKHNGLKHVLFYGNPNLIKYVLGKIPEGLKHTFITPFIDMRNAALQKRKKGRLK